MTQVLTITTAITKAKLLKLVECFLHPAKTGANNATNKSESLLLHALFGSAITTARILTPSLLLLYFHDNPAIMTALNAQNLLLFFVQNDPASQASKLIVEYSKTSLHFRKDCGTFCEGEWVQHQQLNKHNDLVGPGLIGHSGLARLTGSDSLIGLVDFISLNILISLVGFIGRNGLTGLIGLIGLITGLVGLVGLIDCIDHIGRNGCNSLVNQTGLIGCNGLIGLVKLIKLIGPASLALLASSASALPASLALALSASLGLSAT